MAGDRIPLSAVKDIAEVVADPHIAARDMIVDVDYPGGAARACSGCPSSSARRPAIRGRSRPTPGEHNDDVYGRALGLAPDRVAALREQGRDLRWTIAYERRRRRRRDPLRPAREAQRADARHVRASSAGAGPTRATTPTVRVVLLTGAGDRAFCVGADLDGVDPGARLRALRHLRTGIRAHLKGMARSTSRSSPRSTACAWAAASRSCSRPTSGSPRRTRASASPRRRWASCRPAARSSGWPRQIGYAPAMELLLTGEPLRPGAPAARRRAQPGRPPEELLDGRTRLRAERLAGLSATHCRRSRRACSSLADLPARRRLRGRGEARPADLHQRRTRARALRGLRRSAASLDHPEGPTMTATAASPASTSSTPRALRQGRSRRRGTRRGLEDLRHRRRGAPAARRRHGRERRRRHGAAARASPRTSASTAATTSCRWRPRSRRSSPPRATSHRSRASTAASSARPTSR